MFGRDARWWLLAADFGVDDQLCHAGLYIVSA
jgi:hypothetical protein